MTTEDVARHFIEVNGRRVSYLTGRRSAAGPTILLIHGSGVSAACWLNQIRGLGNALRVVAIDLPGHGESEPIEEATVEKYAEVAAGVLEEMGARRAIVAGHSLGGAVAIALAARRPDTVTGLVLLSACAKLPPVDGTWERLLAYLPGTLRKVLFFSMAKKILFAPGAPSRAVSLGMQELRACRPETILKDLEAAKAMDQIEPAKRLDVATLVLCGSRDRLTPPALSAQLGELIPRSQLRTIEGAGHMLQLEVPERVNRELLSFARSVLAKAGLPALTVGENRPRRSRARRLLDWIRGLS